MEQPWEEEHEKENEKRAGGVGQGGRGEPLCGEGRGDDGEDSRGGAAAR